MRIITSRERNLVSSLSLKNSTALKIRVANDSALRRKADSLLRMVYQGKGYLDCDSEEPLSPIESNQAILTILTETEAGKALGTASLESMCAPMGSEVAGKKRYPIPCEAIFSTELKELSSARHRIGEISRLALVTDAPYARSILIRQFNLLYIAARYVFGLSDFVIEVNPRHKKYYEVGFGFKTLGEEKPCPRVGGALACLLHLDLSIPVKALLDREKGRSFPRLYSQFLSRSDEHDVAQSLIQSHFQEMRLDPVRRCLETTSMLRGMDSMSCQANQVFGRAGVS